MRCRDGDGRGCAQKRSVGRSLVASVAGAGAGAASIVSVGLQRFVRGQSIPFTASAAETAAGDAIVAVIVAVVVMDDFIEDLDVGAINVVSNAVVCGNRARLTRVFLFFPRNRAALHLIHALATLICTIRTSAVIGITMFTSMINVIVNVITIAVIAFIAVVFVVIPIILVFACTVVTITVTIVIININVTATKSLPRVS